MAKNNNRKTIALPLASTDGKVSLEQTLANRRSVRHFNDKPLTIEQISQLLRAGQGMTDNRGFRTAPSAGALYPLELYAIIGKAKGIPAGIYHYNFKDHQLINIKSGDFRSELCAAGLSQGAIKKAPITILIAGVFKRTTMKYGQRGIQYVLMEAGHVGQNILLQTVSLGLGAVPIGAFNENDIIRLMDFGPDEQPLYLIPVGHLLWN